MLAISRPMPTMNGFGDRRRPMKPIRGERTRFASPRASKRDEKRLRGGGPYRAVESRVGPLADSTQTRPPRASR